MKKIYMFIALCSFLMLILSGCAKESDDLHTNTVDKTIKRLETHTLEKEIRENIAYQLSENPEAYYVAYDVQVFPLIEEHPEINWYPLYTKTVVLSIDERKVTEDIMEFSDLKNSTSHITLSQRSLLEKEYILLAVDYALSGEELTLEQTIEMFAYLNEKGLFHSSSTSRFLQDIIITTDVDAVWRQKNGVTRDIVIPEDGSFSYQVGIVSKQSLDDFQVITDSMLSDMGYRTKNGICNVELYPNIECYQSVESLAYNPNRYRAIREITGLWSRKVEWKYFFAPASDKEHLTWYVIFSIVLILWGCSIFYRVNQKKIRYAMMVSFLLLLFWLALQMTRILAFDPVLERYAWYLTYFPIIFTVFTVLKVAIHVNGSRLRRIWEIGLIIGGIFFLLIMTNDLHSWMFVFPNGIRKGGWIHDYTFASIFLMLFLAIYIIVTFAHVTYKARKSNASIISLSIWIPPLLLIIYTYAHITEKTLRFHIWEIVPHEMEFVLFYIVLICLSWELQILYGFIPTNRSHQLLFENLGMEIRMVNQDGKTVIESKGKKEIPLENIMYMEKEIHYANVVWGVDMTELNNIQNELIETKKQWTEHKKVLERENEIKEKLYEIKIQNEIMQSMNQSFVKKLDFAKQKVHDVVKGDYSEADATVAYAEILLVYIKMRGHLLLQGMKNEMLPLEAVDKAMKGIVYSANFVGLSCEYFLSVKSQDIYYESFLVIYDCVEEILEQMVWKSQSVVLIFIEESNDMIVLRILLEGTIQKNGILEGVRALKNPDIDVDIRRDEDGTHFVLKLPRRWNE